MNRVERLRSSLNAAHARLAAAVTGVNPVTLENEPAVGVWSARDVVGHLADWGEETLAAAERIARGEKPSDRPITNVASYNVTRSAVRGVDPWDVTWADLEDIQARLLGLLDALRDEQLDAIGQTATGRVTTLAGVIEGLIAHTEEHAAQLEDWRLRRAGVRGREK